MSGGDRGAGRFRPPRPARAADRGFVLLETALAIPLLVLVSVAALAVGRVALTELAVADAARDAALAAARGDAPCRLAARLPAATCTAARTGGMVRVEVAARTELLPIIGAVSVRHTAAATAALEPGA